MRSRRLLWLAAALLAAVLYFGIMCLLQVAILYMAGPSAIQYLMTMAGM